MYYDPNDIYGDEFDDPALDAEFREKWGLNAPASPLPDPKQPDLFADSTSHLAGGQGVGGTPVGTWAMVTIPPTTPEAPMSTSTTIPPKPTTATNPVTSSTHAGYKSVAKPVGMVAVVEPGTTEAEMFTVTETYIDWWEAAQAIYPPVTKEGIDVPVMEVPAHRASVTEKDVPFNACVFSASEDYVKARWGRLLHETDRTWLKWHPLAKDSGVPVEYMLDAIQGLVEPYGLVVARVRYRAGRLTVPPTVLAWADALGCNPFGRGDYTTNNGLALQRMKDSGAELDPKLAEQMWRFEFHAQALGGSIIGEQGWSSGTGINVGAKGGHSRYLAPRATANDWVLSLQLGLAEQVTYDAPPPETLYVRRKGDRNLQFADVKDEFQRAVCVYVNNKYALNPLSEKERGHEPVVPPSTPPTSSATTGATQVAPAPSSTSGSESSKSGGSKPSRSSTSGSIGSGGSKHDHVPSTFTCYGCDKEWKLSRMADGVDRVCRKCYVKAWERYHCPACTCRFGVNPPKPLLRSSEHLVTVFVCADRRCGATLQLKPEDLATDEFAALRLICARVPLD